MSFFLFIKQIVDMLYQYKFLDYIMVGLILLMLVYQIALVRPNLKKWYTKTDVIVLLFSVLVTINFLKNKNEYEVYFKIISAFLMYFFGRIYYDRVQECYGALVSAGYIVIYLNFFYRTFNSGVALTQIEDAGGDLYYYDTDMAFAMILAMVFIAMFAKNTLIKHFTIFVICPYMVLFSDAGIQKALMLAVYGVIFIYIAELVFRKHTITNILLAMMIIGILVIAVVIYLPVLGIGNIESILKLFQGDFFNNSNMYVRYAVWEGILDFCSQQAISEQWFGNGFTVEVNTGSLYIKILYSLGYSGLILMILLIGCITYYVVKVEDRKTFYLATIMAVMLLGTGVTVNSMEYVQMSWYPLLFSGMVVSSVRAEEQISN